MLNVGLVRFGFAGRVFHAPVIRAVEGLRLAAIVGPMNAKIKGREVFSAYVRSPKGPVFMAVIEEAFGKDLTTRTWDTVGKVARAEIR
jgi:predicted dehydrogenase